MKKWTRRFISLTVVLVISCSVSAQNIPLGSWRTHFSYNSVSHLAQGNGKVFVAVENGLFYLDTNDKTISTLSKTDGLSDAGISAISYDDPTKTLIIGYESGLIDLHSQGKVKTIRDLKNSPLVGTKEVFDITSDGTNAYLGTSFGVIVISLDQQEITDNYRSIGTAGDDITAVELAVIGEQLFVLSENVILNGSLSDNLLDFNNWSSQSIATDKMKTLTVGDRLYAIKNDTSIVSISATGIEEVALQNQTLISDLSFEESLFALIENNVLDVSQPSGQTVLTLNGDIRPVSLISSNGLWIGTESAGVISPDLESLFPNGPLSDQITNLTFTNDHLFAFYGLDPELYSNQIDSLGYSQFQNISWTSESLVGFYNISDGAFFNERMLFSSIGFGLYDENLQDTIPNLPRTTNNNIIIPRLELSRGSLFAASFENGSPLLILDTDENLSAYSENEIGTRFPIDLNISEFGSIWITRASFDGGGFVVSNFDNQESRVITGSDGLPSNTVNNLVIDLADEVWIATNNGPAIFTDASFIFNDQDAINPIFESAELFEDEEIYAISADGGNRIWMSTRTGLYIFNNTLSELEHFFNTDNSPLPSNIISDFAYNTTTGEMYMLTSKGLVSYRSNSSLGKSNSSGAKIYPNPVRPGYEGLIGITNLGTDVNVKITDVNGKLIRTLNANGGTASWDITDYNGRRANSGVYIVLVSSQDGIDNYIGKIAVID